MTRFPHINFSFAQSHATNPPSLPSPTFTLPPHRHPTTPPLSLCGLLPGAFPFAKGLGVILCLSLFHCQPQLFFAEALLRLLLFPQPLCTVCAYGGSVSSLPLMASLKRLGSRVAAGGFGVAHATVPHVPVARAEMWKCVGAESALYRWIEVD